MALREGETAEGGCLCEAIRYMVTGPAMFASPESAIYMKDAVARDFSDPGLPKFEAMQPRKR